MRERFLDHLGALAVSQPTQVALSANGVTLTYAELPGEIARRGQQLAAMGGRRVALMLDNGLDWALWDLALMQSEAVNVPLPMFFSPAQLAHVVAQAGIDTLIGPAAVAAALGFTASDDLLLWQREVAAPPRLPAGTHKITFTSGTSGTPKGVCLDSDTQLTVADSLAEVARSVGVRRHLAMLPLATLLENIGGLYAPLWLGGSVTLPGLGELGWRGASGFDSTQAWRVIRAEAPDSLILVPQLLSALLMQQGETPLEFGRFFAVGGATVSPALLARAAEAGWPVFEGYGLSECASVVTLNRPGEVRSGSVGRPLPHARITLAEDGEVMVEGSLMLGYLGDDAPRPSRWPTGDLGAWEGEALVLKGRRRQVFITAYGRNVDPAWVEAELTAEPAIAQAWVSGEAQPSNRALLVPRGEWVNDQQLEEAVTRANLRLPDYARVACWQRGAPFTPDNGLATANGRLRREALAERYRRWLDTPVSA
ncbi:AMP-binding protein [Salinicola sp. DM10]|uniref:AMP-binding protein n=1 Tax=Salinicola sp. DM10 TaxID=2815721 RepID=UPI001A8CC1E7|nr:AMP-binding protein [Salinicola sp. DM10]MCE3026514.1 AMP-binding protein [Salinicola sp. DM10]